MMRRNSAASPILVGGLIAGAIDITYAISFSYFRSGVSPARLLQSVASGLLGNDAFKGGVPVAALGLALHFTIALLWATLFYFASRRVPDLVKHAVPAGILYGAVIYGAMNLIVLPLSAFPRPVRFTFWPTSTGLLVHMLGIGLPIALATRKAALAPMLATTD